MHIIQDILIVLLAGYMTIDQNGPVVMSWFSVIVGTISGLIMGDLNTGLMIGGTFQLMSLGVAALGGASAPNYGLATIIGTFIAVRTGTGIDAAVGVGLPVGLLAIQLEVVVRIVNNFVAHKMQRKMEKHEPDRMGRTAALFPSDNHSNSDRCMLWCKCSEFYPGCDPTVGDRRAVHCSRNASCSRYRNVDALYAG